MADSVDVLVVGPAGAETGGIQRYIDEQVAHLPSSVSARVYDVAVSEGSGLKWLLTSLLLALGQLLRFPLQRRPDVVHLHSSHYRSFYQSAGYALWAAYVWQVPVVLHVHGSSFDRFVDEASPPVAFVQSLVFDACEAVVVLSEYWRDVLEQRVPVEKLVVVPNAVELAAYPEPDGTDAESAMPHLVFVSNHIERKGIREFVAAVRTLEERESPPFRVTIAGRGPLSDLATDLAAEYDDVDYVGYVTEAEKRSLLASGTIYALPTYAEGLPIAILEAMAGGNAIVTTDVGSIPAVVDDANGRLVAPGDADALADALAALLADPALTAQLGAASRDRVAADYDWSGHAEALVSLYDRLLRSGNGTVSTRMSALTES